MFASETNHEFMFITAMMTARAAIVILICLYQYKAQQLDPGSASGSNESSSESLSGSGDESNHSYIQAQTTYIYASGYIVSSYLPFQSFGANKHCLDRRLDGISRAIYIPNGIPIGDSIQVKAYVSPL